MNQAGTYISVLMRQLNLFFSHELSDCQRRFLLIRLLQHEPSRGWKRKALLSDVQMRKTIAPSVFI